MGDYLELLPAVDVKGGQAVQLVQGVDGSEKRFGDPLRGCPALAGDRGRVDPSGRPRRRVRPRQQPPSCSPASSASSTSRSRCPAASATTSRCEAALATGCRPRQHRHRRAGGPGVVRPGRSATYGDRRRDRARRARAHPRGPRLDHGRRRPLSRRWTAWTQTGCARYVVTDVNKDGMLAGPNLDLLRDGLCRAPTRPVIASGGVSTLDDLRALAGLVRPPASRARSPARPSTPAPSPRRGARRCTLGNVPELHGGTSRMTAFAIRGHPVSGRGRRPGGEGRQLRRPARRRRPGGAGGGLRRGGRRRAHLPRRHRVLRRPGRCSTWSPHRRAGLHPADRGRRRPLGGRRGPPAAGRRRQGRGQYRGDRPAGADRRDRRPVRQPGARAVARRRRRGRHGRAASRSPRTAAASGTGSTRWSGPGASPSWARGRSCSTRWTPTAPRPASTSS